MYDQLISNLYVSECPDKFLRVPVTNIKPSV